MSNEDDKRLDIDAIMDEIEAGEDAVPSTAPPLPDSPPESTAIVRSSKDDIADRRVVTWELKQRGLTYREISAETGVSIATVKTDLDAARKDHIEYIDSHNREEYLAKTITAYDDLIKECWKITRGADKETKLKAIQQIRMTLNDKRKALQDTGVVKKENQVIEHVDVTLINSWSEENRQEAVQALIGMKMTGLAAPTLDIEEAEIIEDDEDGDSES